MPRRRQSPIAIGIDHFKAVNDLHWHEAGDAVLQSIARTASRIAEAEKGALARIGGDEFVMLLPAGCEGQRRIAEALMDQSRTEFSSPYRWSLSMGLAQVEDNEQVFEAALRRADAALYRAKAVVGIVWSRWPPEAARESLGLCRIVWWMVATAGNFLSTGGFECTGRIVSVGWGRT